MQVEAVVQRFKMELLRKMPFYGDIIMRLPFVENPKIPTACTDGGKIEYNPAFFQPMTVGQINFVLMHEVFHVLLFHCSRHGERRPDIWNTAADMIVNSMLMDLSSAMRNASIPFERPKNGIYSWVETGDTVENVYEKLLQDNKSNGNGKAKNTVLIRSRYSRNPEEVVAPHDVILSAGEPDDASGSSRAQSESLSEQAVRQIIREAASANRGSIGSYFVPEQIFRLVESRRIKWQTLLRDFFLETQSDEASYTTPERKYIHMDLILPGHGMDDEKIEAIWAFVDSSGSIGHDEMNQFLTQLYRIAHQFKCTFHLCYWDTQVTDVYRNINDEEEIFKSLPKHSGGTDINCVYRWLRDNKVRPDVMLILTDGYFGSLDRGLFTPSLGKKTILVLSGSIPISDEMKKMGKIARLEGS